MAVGCFSINIKYLWAFYYEWHGCPNFQSSKFLERSSVTMGCQRSIFQWICQAKLCPGGTDRQRPAS